MSEMTTLPSGPDVSMNNPPPEIDAADAMREERVSVMYGDRLCTKCHYNLIGQPVIREPHYGMLIARCPECATVAALQDYPQLGRWAHRWAVVLSIVWLLVILGVTVGTIPAVIATMFEFGDLGTQPYRHELGAHWQNWYEAEYDAPPNSSRWNPDKFDEWLAANPSDEILSELSGFWTVIRTPDLFFYLVPASFAFVYGCFIALALVHQRRRTLAMLALGLLLLGGGLFATIWYQSVTSQSIDNFRDLADLQIFYPLTAIGYTGLWFLLLTGAMYGRPLVRGLVRILLPPRLRGSLAVLWTTDGLLPPTGTGQRR